MTFSPDRIVTPPAPAPALIKSKRRVADHGEVFTPPWLVEQMLDLVRGETARIDARFLEPACGSGNFLVPILQRKLAAVEVEHGGSEFEKRHHALFALSCVYGIELLADNIAECRAGMLAVFAEYLKLDEADELYRAASHVLSLNLIHGDAMTMKDVPQDGREPAPITVVEWSYLGEGRFGRRDFRLDVLAGMAGVRAEGTLFAGSHAHDLFRAERDHPPTTVRDLAAATPPTTKLRSGQCGATMRFDVLIGNPPYQLSDGGHGASASPIYQKFVEQAKALEPRYLSLVIPSRWFGGGKGLGDFRAAMLNDDRLRHIVDFENASDAFPGVDLAGGVCYFLWDREERGACRVTNIAGDGPESTTERRLNEFSSFVRHGAAVPIIRKVIAQDHAGMSRQVSGRKPFGLATTARPERSGDLILRWEKGEGPYPRHGVTTGLEMIDRWKVITSYVAYDHAGNPGKDGRRKVFSKIDLLPPGSICTETYLVVGHYETRGEAANLATYMRTRLFRFLVAQFMYSHHLTRAAYGFVPVLDMTREWDDDALAMRYGLTDEEVAFISSKIRAF